MRFKTDARLRSWALPSGVTAALCLSVLLGACTDSEGYRWLDDDEISITAPFRVERVGWRILGEEEIGGEVNRRWEWIAEFSSVTDSLWLGMAQGAFVLLGEDREVLDQSVSSTGYMVWRPDVPAFLGEWRTTSASRAPNVIGVEVRIRAVPVSCPDSRLDEAEFPDGVAQEYPTRDDLCDAIERIGGQTSRGTAPPHTS